MNYVQYLNASIKEAMKDSNTIAYGQNIVAASCLSGLTRGLDGVPGIKAINTTNSEATLAGVGYGAIINGTNAAFFMKQLDFLMLGTDQLVNTQNFIRLQKNVSASYTIFPILVDSGYEGPQSSFNSLFDYANLVMIQSLTMSTKQEIDHLVPAVFHTPGVKIATVSQRLYKKELKSYDDFEISDETGIARYGVGNDVTIVTANYACEYGLQVQEKLAQEGIKASVFNIFRCLDVDFTQVLSHSESTGRLLAIDDSKSTGSILDPVTSAAAASKYAQFFRRGKNVATIRPNPDNLEIDVGGVTRDILKSCI